MLNPHEVLYEVFETDADLLELKLVHQGYSRDIAEAKTLKCFKASSYQKDYMLVNHNKQEIIWLCLCADTLSKRGECHQ